MSGFGEVNESRKEFEKNNIEKEEKSFEIKVINEKEYENVDKSTGKILEKALKKFGFTHSNELRVVSDENKVEGKQNYTRYIEENTEGKYCDRETGKKYDSIDAWKDMQETLAKRYESISELYKQKMNTAYDCMKNAEKYEERQAHWRKYQEACAKYEESKEKASIVNRKLAGNAIIRNEVEDKKVDTRLPVNNGKWEGEEGNSNWIPDLEYVPPEKSRNPETSPYSNPDNSTWGEILEKYKIKGIVFKDGFPVFDDISRGTVEIDNFETGGSEAKDHNFKKADIEMAKQRGCTPQEVREWRKENNYTWHECEDKKTMQKVPNEVHANIPHDGGRSQE